MPTKMAPASLPPTSNSLFDLAAPGAHWHHPHHHSLAPPAQECGRGMCGMSPAMGGGMGADVAIAGTGQYMNVSGYIVTCESGG